MTEFTRIYDGTLASTGKPGESMRAVGDALSHHGWTSDSERCYAAAAEIDRLNSRVAELERDAKRYRFIRANKFERYGNGQEHVIYFPAGHVVSDFDTVIDAAIAAALEASR